MTLYHSRLLPSYNMLGELLFFLSQHVATNIFGLKLWRRFVISKIIRFPSFGYFDGMISVILF